MANARRAVAPAVTAVIAAAVAQAAYTALTRGAPGGAARWARTNHRGEPVTLLEGPAAALAGAARGGALGRLTIERADGSAVQDSPLARALEEAGFRPTPRGLRLRAQVA